MSITETRANELLRLATSTAQKVYDAVPIEDSWTSLQIMAELLRRNLTMDFRIVQGCLNSLKDAGLIKETMKNCFIREPIREKAAKPQSLKDKIDMASKQTAIPLEQPKEAGDSAAMDVIGRLATRAQEIHAAMNANVAEAQRLAAEMDKLATAVSDAAVEVQEIVEANSADAAKLKGLQAAFKSLGLTA